MRPKSIIILLAISGICASPITLKRDDSSSNIAIDNEHIASGAVTFKVNAQKLPRASIPPSTPGAKRNNGLMSTQAKAAALTARLEEQEDYLDSGDRPASLPFGECFAKRDDSSSTLAIDGHTTGAKRDVRILRTGVLAQDCKEALDNYLGQPYTDELLCVSDNERCLGIAELNIGEDKPRPASSLARSQIGLESNQGPDTSLTGCIKNLDDCMRKQPNDFSGCQIEYINYQGNSAPRTAVRRTITQVADTSSGGCKEAFDNCSNLNKLICEDEYERCIGDNSVGGHYPHPASSSAETDLEVELKQVKDASSDACRTTLDHCLTHLPHGRFICEDRFYECLGRNHVSNQQAKRTITFVEDEMAQTAKEAWGKCIENPDANRWRCFDDYAHSLQSVNLDICNENPHAASEFIKCDIRITPRQAQDASPADKCEKAWRDCKRSALLNFELLLECESQYHECRQEYPFSSQKAERTITFNDCTLEQPTLMEVERCRYNADRCLAGNTAGAVKPPPDRSLCGYNYDRCVDDVMHACIIGNFPKECDRTLGDCLANPENLESDCLRFRDECVEKQHKARCDKDLGRCMMADGAIVWLCESDYGSCRNFHHLALHSFLISPPYKTTTIRVRDSIEG